jgi:hypothetical protein
MAPWVGIVLAAITGSWRFFLQTLTGLLIGAALIFITGFLAGFAGRIFGPLNLSLAYAHSRLWWPDIFILILGAILLSISFARSEEKPVLPSAMLAYELYLPLSAAAIGLGSGITTGLWPDGLLVFFIYLALATLVGIISMVIIGFRPYTLAGYTLGTTLTLVVIIAIIFLSGLGTVITSRLALSNPGFSAGGATPTLTLPTATSVENNLQPVPATKTLTPSRTITLVFPTPETPTATPPPLPTPVFAKVFTDQGTGIVVRTEPNGTTLTTLLNGYLVEVLPEIQKHDRAIWVKIRFTIKGETYEGWVIQTLLRTATPAPNWQPTATP